MPAEIILSTGAIALVDTVLYPQVNLYSWNQHDCGYPSSTIKGKTLLLHAVIFKIKKIEIPTSMEIDHWNRNKLVNQFENLKLVTSAQNKYNYGLLSTNTSGFRGVTWDIIHKCWSMYIHRRNRKVCLGNYKDKEKAIEARLRAERNLGIKIYRGDTNV